MKTLYFDCFAGASGNMILGALVGTGLDPERLIKRLGRLSVSGFEIEFSKVDRSGISAVYANVKVPHEHHHRHLSDIEEIIQTSDLSDTVKQRSTAIFRRLAEVEAAVHGIDIGKVHFHEVGALDAIVDIVGACIGFEMLGIEQFGCSKIHVGSGFVEMAHGKFPVPPPAVANLLEGFRIYSTDIEGELITPTGAAIISTLCTGSTIIPEMEVEVTGYGAGSRTYEKFPNVLRLLVGNTANVPETSIANGGVSVNGRKTESLVLLETNIDDISPQVLGYVMERSFELGALDCWFTSIQMKKNRPASMLSVLCERQLRSRLTDMLYRETTTLGIRVREIERESLERELVEVETEFGHVEVKLAKLNGRIVNAMPEYEQIRKLALDHKVPFRVVRDAVLANLSERAAAAKY